MKQQEYYKLHEAAKEVGVSKDTMRRWIRAEKVDSVKTPGGHYRIHKSTVNNLCKHWQNTT